MEITVKSTLILSEGKRKDSSPYKMVGIVATNGKTYGTFHESALSIKPGTVLMLDGVGMKYAKDGKEQWSCKDYEVVSEPQDPGGGSHEEGKNGMTPEAWAEKDRLERRSKETNACFMGLPALIQCQPCEGKALEVWEAAMDYAKAHFELLTPVITPDPKGKPAPDPVPSKTAVPQSTKATTNGSGKPPATLEELHALQFENMGAFYTACKDHLGINKTTADKDIYGAPTETPDQRHIAWLTLVSIYRKPEGDGEIKPEDLPF